MARICAFLLLCLLAASCNARNVSSTQRTSGPGVPPPLSAKPPSQSPSAPLLPSDQRPTPKRATPQVTLTNEQLAALRQRYPHAVVQSAVAIPLEQNVATLALVWELPASAETRCPPEAQWSAWDQQSCAGFKDALAGLADLVLLAQSTLIQAFPLQQFFQHDANPSGVEIDGRRGSRLAFIPRDYRLALFDLNGDGRASEVLFHVGNGPYAMLEHFVAVGIFRDHLESARTKQGGSIAVGLDAWLDLERTGRGSTQLECGARCGYTATRWLIERNSQGLVDERSFWTCTSDQDATWKEGEPDGSCAR